MSMNRYKLNRKYDMNVTNMISATLRVLSSSTLLKNAVKNKEILCSHTHQGSFMCMFMTVYVCVRAMEVCRHSFSAYIYRISDVFMSGCHLLGFCIKSHSQLYTNACNILQSCTFKLIITQFWVKGIQFKISPRLNVLTYECNRLSLTLYHNNMI